MHAGQPIAEALHGQLAPLAKALRKKLRKAAGGKPKAVHDARIILRRLQEGLTVMGRTTGRGGTAFAVADSLRSIERRLGPTRDDSVLLEQIAGWLTRAGADRAETVQPMVEWLNGERRRHARSMAVELRRRRTRRVLRRLDRWLSNRLRHAAEVRPSPAKAAPFLVRHFIPEETWHAYGRILAFELRPLTGVDVIHKVRSACRRLRYVLELFQSALPSAAAAAIIASLQRLQDRLGDLHDHAVAVDRLEMAVHSAKFPDSVPLQEYLAHRRQLRDQMVAEFQEEWRLLRGEAFRFALSHLVSGEGTEGAVALVPATRTAA